MFSQKITRTDKWQSRKYTDAHPKIHFLKIPENFQQVVPGAVYFSKLLKIDPQDYLLQKQLSRGVLKKQLFLKISQNVQERTCTGSIFQ